MMELIEKEKCGEITMEGIMEMLDKGYKSGAYLQETENDVGIVVICREMWYIIIAGGRI